MFVISCDKQEQVSKETNNLSRTEGGCYCGNVLLGTALAQYRHPLFFFFGEEDENWR